MVRKLLIITNNKMEEVKFCVGPTCNGYWKPISLFIPNNHSFDGYEKDCKHCKLYKRVSAPTKCVNCDCKIPPKSPICDTCRKLPKRKCPTCLTVKPIPLQRSSRQLSCDDCKKAQSKKEKQILKEMAVFYAKNLLRD